MNIGALLRAASLASVVNLIQRVVSAVGWVFLTPYLLDVLGAEVYGAMIALSVLGFGGAGSLLELGLSSGMAQRIAWGEQRGIGGTRELAWYGIKLFLGLGLASGLIVLFLTPFLSRRWEATSALDAADVTVLAGLISLALLAELAASGAMAVLEGTGRFLAVSAIQLMRAVIQIGAIFWMVSLSEDLIGWQVAITLSSGFAACALGAATWATVRRSPRARSGMLRRQKRLALGIGWRVYLLRLLGIAYNSVDRVLLGAWAPGLQSSRYDAANRVHTLALIPMSLPGQFISPIAARLSGARRLGTLAEFWQSGTVLLCAVTVPLVFGLMSCVDGLMDLWLAGRLPNLGALTFVYLLNVLVFVIPQVGWSISIGMGRAKALTAPAVAGIATNVVLSIVLVLLGYGPLGVIVGTIVGNLVASVFYMKRISGIVRHPWKVVIEAALLRVYLPSLLIIASAASIVRSATDVAAFHVVGSIAATFVAFLIVGQRCRRELELVRRVLDPRVVV